MNLGFTIILLVIAGLLIILGLISHDEHKKINKAAKALGIPDKYKEEVKHYLLNIYKHHHNSMLRETDYDFLQRMGNEQPKLLKLILGRVKWSTERDEIQHMIFSNCGPTFEVC